MYVWKTFRDETNTEKEKPLIYVHKRYIIEKKPVFGDGHRIVDNVPDGESRGGGGASGVGVSGAISGALNPYSKEAQEHADRYYEAVRHMTTDTKKISDATRIKKDKIDKIKNHIFVREHDLIDGHKRFDASYDMAQSWQRLTNGKLIQKKDMVLLKHEYMELRLMEKGLSQNEAHIKASKRYNYAKYCE